MTTVGVYEAKARFSSLLDEVERGGVVTITRHGKAIAQLAPAEVATKSPEEIAAILSEFDEFREGHRGVLEGLSIKELIEEGRR